MTYCEKYLKIHRRYRKLIDIETVNLNIVNTRDLPTCWILPSGTNWYQRNYEGYNKLISTVLAKDVVLFLKNNFGITCSVVDIVGLENGIRDCNLFGTIKRIVKNNEKYKGSESLRKIWDTWFYEVEIEK